MMTKTIWLFVIGGACLTAASPYISHHHKNPSTTQVGFNEAMSVSNRASFELDIEPKRAMYLFTAEGEKSWVPGWNPAILKGDGYEIGSVFTIHNGTFITVTFNRETYRIFYTYTSPLEASTLEIDLEDNHKGGSIVTVQWNSTGLSPEGNEKVAHFDQEALVRKLAHWKDLIENHKPKVMAFLQTVPN